VAGRMTQIKGKVNEVVGAARGDIGQEAKGKVQKVVGKVKSELSKSDKRAARNQKRDDLP